MYSPIILIDGGDVTMFGTKEEAESWIEWWAIEEAVGFDATARPLAFSLSKNGATKITYADDKPQDEQVLAHSLRQYLIAIGIGEHLVRHCDLRTLVSMAAQYAMMK